MNRPTPDPSQEGSRHSSASCWFPSQEWGQAFVRALSVPLLGGVRGGFVRAPIANGP